MNKVSVEKELHKYSGNKFGQFSVQQKIDLMGNFSHEILSLSFEYFISIPVCDYNRASRLHLLINLK